MRIRPRHIIVALLAAITAFLLYAARLHTSATPSDNESGLAPPLDMSMEQAPQIALDTHHLDFGTIANDQAAETTVPVYNHGGGLLQITDVRSSCPVCTIGYFDPGKHRIPPGASARMNVKVNPEGIYGFHSQKTLTLWSNDPRNPHVVLTVEARVAPEFEVEPEHFDFGEIEKGTPARRSLVFRSITDSPVRIRKVSLNSDMEKTDVAPLITFDVEELPEADRRAPERPEYQITAAVSPEMGGGDFEISVFIHTDLKRFSPFRTVAKGRVITPYEVTLDQETSELHLRGRASGMITVRGERPVSVSDIRSEHGVVEIQQNRESPEATQIRCAASETLKRGVHKDAVLFNVEMDGRVYPERISVTVYAYETKPRDNR